MPEQTQPLDFKSGVTIHKDMTGHNGLDQVTFLFLRGQLANADAKVKEAQAAKKKVRQHLMK